MGCRLFLTIFCSELYFVHHQKRKRLTKVIHRITVKPYVKIYVRLFYWTAYSNRLSNSSWLKCAVSNWATENFNWSPFSKSITMASTFILYKLAKADGNKEYKHKWPSTTYMKLERLYFLNRPSHLRYNAGVTAV